MVFIIRVTSIPKLATDDKKRSFLSGFGKGSYLVEILEKHFLGRYTTLLLKLFFCQFHFIFLAHNWFTVFFVLCAGISLLFSRLGISRLLTPNGIYLLKVNEIMGKNLPETYASIFIKKSSLLMLFISTTTAWILTRIYIMTVML